MRGIKKLFGAVFAVIAVFLMSMSVWASESGTCGDGVNYTLDSGVLTLTGSGEVKMNSFKNRSDITKVMLNR